MLFRMPVTSKTVDRCPTSRSGTAKPGALVALLRRESMNLNQPLTAPEVNPPINSRCNTRNNTAIGKIDRNVPARKRP